MSESIHTTAQISRARAYFGSLRNFWRRFREYELGLVGLAIVLAVAFVAISAPILSPKNPYALSSNLLAPPSGENFLGTDMFGRDILSQIIWGSRIVIIFAAVVALISAFLGVFIGALAGYYTGWVENLFLSRIIDIFLMIPRFFLIILMTALFGGNIVTTMIIVGITWWPTNARLMRAQVLGLKSREFVDASISLGASSHYILFKHIIPNGVSPIVANSTLQMAHAIIIEAGLSFLGLGDPSQFSWGQILRAAQENIQAWWMILFPGIAILILALGFNLIGEGISYALNPRLHELRIQEKVSEGPIVAAAS